MSTPRLSLSAQAETVRILVEQVLPGSKAVSQKEAELLKERGETVIKTLTLLGEDEQALREWLQVRAHMRKHPTDGG